jgi:hypothetical protein
VLKEDPMIASHVVRSCRLGGLIGAWVTLLIAAVPGLAAPGVDPPQDFAEIDHEALDELARATRYLRKLPSFVVRAEVLRDQVVHDDFKLQRASNVRVVVRRPDRMRAEVSGDQGERLFAYDGKLLGIYLKSENYYGAMPAPPSLRELIDVVTAQHAIELPLLDVIYVAMGGDLQQRVRAAGVIGSSVVDGVACTHLAFRSDDVDWQFWIEQGSRPVPRKMVITSADAPSLPQYSAVMRWDVAPTNAYNFTFLPPDGTMTMKLGSAAR